MLKKKITIHNPEEFYEENIARIRVLIGRKSFDQALCYMGSPLQLNEIPKI
jgi:hypothetical protein